LGPRADIERTLRIAAAMLAAAAPGCSWIGWGLQKPPPLPVEPSTAIHCTTDKVAPILDTVGAAAFVGLGVAGMVTVHGSCSGGAGSMCGLQEAAFGLSLSSAAIGVLYGASAVYGYGATGRCARLIEWENACAKGDARACERLRGAPEPDPAAGPERR